MEVIGIVLPNMAESPPEMRRIYTRRKQNHIAQSMHGVVRMMVDGMRFMEAQKVSVINLKNRGTLC